MYVYTATIGRNVTPGILPVPMSDERWEQFIADVKADMRAALLGAMGVGDDVEVHRGNGVWQGVKEESAMLTILCEYEALPDDLADLRDRLASASLFYNQDAIALTIGTSELL